MMNGSTKVDTVCQLLLTHYEDKKATLTTDYNNDKLISMVDNKLDVNDRVTDINYPESDDEVKGLELIYMRMDA